METLQKIADWLQVSLAGNGSLVIRDLVLDSRKIITPEAALFFALVGNKTDGHLFLHDAYRKGVRAFVVQHIPTDTSFPEAEFLVVSNTLDALQLVACRYRQQFNLPIIGITGSNGKTIIKEWLFELLAPDFSICRSPKSYNSQIGVPLSLWKLENHHQKGIFEAGISRKGEMERLEKMIQPDFGIFTTIGPAHDAGFASPEEKIAEKAQLFKNCPTVYCCGNRRTIVHALETANPQANIKTWAVQRRGHRFHFAYYSDWTYPEEADLLIINSYDICPGLNHVKYQYKGKTATLTLHFHNPGLIENFFHCLLVLLEMGYSNEQINARAEHLRTLPLRAEVIKGIEGSVIINDSYSSDLGSLEVAIQSGRDQMMHYQPRSGVLILSEMDETGMSPKELAVRVYGMINNSHAYTVYTIGRPFDFQDAYFGHFEHFDSTDAFLAAIPRLDFHKKVVLLKGGRRFQFERIAERLSRKVHDTKLEVNTEAVRHNLGIYARHCLPQIKKMLMVKADAYGMGAAEIAKTLEYEGANYLAVAYIDEGVELRKADIDLPIMVLRPEKRAYTKLSEYRLEPEVFSLQQLEELLLYSAKNYISLRIHIKLDTGMHRLGFEAEDINALIALLKKEHEIVVASIFSHLAASESAQLDAFSEEQLNRFTTMYEQIAEGIGYRPDRHILNSSGILRFPQFHFEMVRLGLGLYGIDPTGLVQAELRTVQRLVASISQIKTIAAGETVGYNRRGKVAPGSRIATLSIGYADGLWRAAGNGNFAVKIGEKYAPTVGNICMDMTMVDITKIPEAQVGDRVVVFETADEINALAKTNNTIPYEVFTAVGSRVKRVYVDE